MQERSISVYIFRYYIYNIISTRVASSCVNSGSWSKKMKTFELAKQRHNNDWLIDRLIRLCVGGPWIWGGMSQEQEGCLTNLLQGTFSQGENETGWGNLLFYLTPLSPYGNVSETLWFFNSYKHTSLLLKGYLSFKASRKILIVGRTLLIIDYNYRHSTCLDFIYMKIIKKSTKKITTKNCLLIWLMILFSVKPFNIT